MWKSGENYFSIANMCIWSDDPSVSRLGRVWAINSLFLVAKVAHGLGSAFPEGDMSWNLLFASYFCWSSYAPDGKWRISKVNLCLGKQPQRVPSPSWLGVQGCAAPCYSLIGCKTEKRPGFSKIFGFVWFFSPLKERLCFWNKIK